MITWKLVSLPIKSLKEHPKNPREITKDKMRLLSNFIDKYNLIEKPVVNANFIILSGHQRIKKLKKDKVKEVECWMPDRTLNEEEMDELCIGLNLHGGKWDWDTMANEWEPTKLLEYGFDSSEIFGLFDDSVKDFEEKQQQQKKKKSCPNCGHEF